VAEGSNWCVQTRALTVHAWCAIFTSRWILAPFFIGLIIAMFVPLLKFGKELVSLTRRSSRSCCLSLCSTMNFVSKLSIGDHEDRWLEDRRTPDLRGLGLAVRHRGLDQ